MALQLPAFSGPLDLLLHLIQKNRISIYDIPVALVCDQYQSHLRSMQELDLGVAADFLWMASWLLELKSRLLLPRSGEEEEDPRQELVERLLEYRRCKELASMLQEREAVRRGLWAARVGVEPAAGETEVDWEEVDLRTIARVYLETMQRFEASHPPPLEVPPLRFRVEDTMKELYRRVMTERLVPLLRHLYTRADVDEMVVLVVAALELVRLGGVAAEQRLPFSEIFLRPGPAALDAERLLGAEASHGA